MSDDSFNSSADVDLFPIRTLNMGDIAQASLQPLGIDVAPRGRLFRFDAEQDAWVPGDGRSLSDGLSTGLHLMPRCSKT